MGKEMASAFGKVAGGRWQVPGATGRSHCHPPLGSFPAEASALCKLVLLMYCPRRTKLVNMNSSTLTYMGNKMHKYGKHHIIPEGPGLCCLLGRYCAQHFEHVPPL